jgi:hypothetical protein
LRPMLANYSLCVRGYLSWDCNTPVIIPIDVYYITRVYIATLKQENASDIYVVGEFWCVS